MKNSISTFPGANFFGAVALAARFNWHCRTYGWARKSNGWLGARPDYEGHIHSACRGAGMSFEQAHAFSRQWARDMGGTGPL